ncbi:probable transcription initiation factor TFIID subunit 11 at C-terminar half [Coccomyxa sp. Obi]|nr:probable transcription initiation factor TFIID subunit 11 at C-terminar half [Coccomyxa sp. Obi]
MEEEDDFDLENELERELEAGIDLDEEEDEAPSTLPRAQLSAEVPSGQAPSGQMAIDSSAAEEPEPEEGLQENAEMKEALQLGDKRQERQRKNKEVMKLLTEEQLDRYEAFRRSKLSSANMRKLLHNVTGQAPHFNTTIVMCGIAKLFVGELVETARMVAAHQGDSGPLLPEHLREAYQQLDRQGRIPHRGRKPRGLRML